MSYRIIYQDISTPREDWRRETDWSEEFSTEQQALGRARELIEDGEHNRVVVHDHSGNQLSGVRLQLRLGGFKGD